MNSRIDALDYIAVSAAFSPTHYEAAMTQPAASPSAAKRHTDRFRYRALTEEDLAFYDENGYLLVGRTLTDEGLGAMRAQCMEVWHREKSGYDADSTWLQNALLPDIHHHAPIVRDYYFEGPLVDIATQVIGPNVKGVTSQLTFKMRGNTSAFGWHQDNNYGELSPYNAISCLTAFDDVDEENGCLWVIPGSHKRGQIELEHSAEDKAKKKEINVEVDEAKAVPVPMKAGECLFFGCWTLHKSKGNVSDRDRRILFLRYADADAVEVYNDGKPRLGRLLRGETRFDEVAAYEASL